MNNEAYPRLFCGCALSKLSGSAKLGLVIGGYVLACIAARGVVYLWQLSSQGPGAQASSGMYAFGDLILFLGAAGLLMLLPTGLAVYFLVRWAPGRRETKPGDNLETRGGISQPG